MESGFSGYQQLTDWLSEQGYQISKSSVHRYGQDIQERIDAVKISTEHARAVVAATPDDEGAVNEALMRLVQERLFTMLLEFDVDSVKKLNLGSLARAIAELGRASVVQKKWMAEVRDRAARAAEEVGNMVRKGGLSEESVDMIRRRVLGIAG